MPFLGTTGGGSVRQFGGLANLGYFIKNSLRFRRSNSAYLNRTPGSASNRRTWTWSGWVKRGALSTADSTLFNAGTTGIASDNVGFFGIRFTDGDQLDLSTGLTNTRRTTQVFRDPAAWYHIVVAMDTTQATGANRVKVYVNGTEVTAFVSSNDPSPNLDTAVNNNVVHEIGRTTWSGSTFFDGYMAEVNFVDGQQLTPSSFGKTDGATGQWIPKKFAGTYGTNGFYLKFADASAATAAAIGKDSSGNGNNWTPNNIDVSTPTAIKSFTTTGSSTWIAPVGVTSVNYLVVAGGGAGGSAGPTMYDSGSGGGGAGGVANGSLVIIPGTSYTLTVGTGGTGSSGRTRGANGSNSVFATITAIGGGGGAPGVAGSNGAAGGSGGGSSVSGIGGAATPGQGFAGGSSTTSSGAGGGGATGAGSASPNNRGGDGGAGFPSSISGSPVIYAGGGGGGAYSGSPGPGGTGGSSIGGDGGTNNSNGSNATGYGSGGGGSGGTYNTTGTLSGGSGSQGIVILSYTSPTSNTYDAMIDSPTLSAVASNYAVMNPLDKRSLIELTNANLHVQADNSGSWGQVRATMAMTSGKWYWEFVFNTGTNSFSTNGIGNSGTSLSLDYAPSSWANVYQFMGNGTLYANNTSSSYGSSLSSGDVLMVAFDRDNSAIYFGKNGNWFNSSNPATQTSPAASSISTSLTFFPMCGSVNASGGDINFGQQPFAYTPPSGFKSLNTFNLP
jgi:hypothetical protein